MLSIRTQLSLWVVISLIVSGVLAKDSDMVIIYPKPNQTVTATDSTFILGHIPDRLLKEASNLIVRVNGDEFPIHSSGGFLAWVPVTPGQFTFQVDCFRKKDIPKSKISNSNRLSDGSVIVTIPQPLKSVSEDTLLITGDYLQPIGNVTLNDNDMLEVHFQGTPKCNAWFSIPGVVDSIPMAEMAPHQQKYWGESVFGIGGVPDSLMINGLYSGFYNIPCSVKADSVSIVYHLSYLSGHKKKGSQSSIIKESGYKVTLNSKEYPFTVRFSDSVQVIRYKPSMSYSIILQPKGIEALAVGAEGDWYRIKLSSTQYGYVNKSSVKRLPYGLLPPVSNLKSVRTFGFPDSVLVEFPLGGMHPFQVIEDDKRTIRIRLFGVYSNTDWIRYDFSDTLIEMGTWSQPEDGVYEFKLILTQDIWGYDAFYNGSNFYFKLIKPPHDVHDLRGKTIVLDPGHSPDNGAIGPTGYTEAEANLALAKTLKEMLTLRGANVVMTRSDMGNLPLVERPAIANTNHADLFVSIHNNAQPDGVNPNINNGVSTYYYHQNSIDLAKAIQSELIAQTGLKDYGLFFGNLHVVRPTQYPAVLVECAFIILPEQEAMLKSDTFKRDIAKSITNGIENFLKEYNHER
jgi:N-acetylmuramoyl-L-alanine amidase